MSSTERPTQLRRQRQQGQRLGDMALGSPLARDVSPTLKAEVDLAESRVDDRLVPKTLVVPAPVGPECDAKRRAQEPNRLGRG